jgi:crotonobetainyl-CoA:carnitine CoA-transferase CaiB-like acyl-CoA transferase
MSSRRSKAWGAVSLPRFDGYIMTGALNDGAWIRLCEAVEQINLRDNPNFATTASRLGHRAYLVQTFQDIFVTRTAADWITRPEAAGVAAGPINTLDQVFSHEQTIANGMIAPVARAGQPAMNLLGLPFKLGAQATPSSLHPRNWVNTQPKSCEIGSD